MERKEEVRVALEIRTSLRPERPGTTPEGDKKQRDSRERKRTDNPGQNTDRNKGGKSKPKQKGETEAPTKTRKGPEEPSTTAKGREERNKKEKVEPE